MKYISTPLEFNEEGTRILREIDDRIKVLDNLVELIVFTLLLRHLILNTPCTSSSLTVIEFAIMNI